MSDSEFYHAALIRRLRERDDCDDDIRGACDEIEDCYESIERLEAEIASLRLTDAEREAIERSISRLLDAEYYGGPEPASVVTLRGLLERTK